MYHTIKRRFKNTIISFHWAKKYRCQYQCFLKSQADYLTDKGKRGDRSFFYLNEGPCNSKLCPSHFRSSYTKRELTEVSNWWLEALQNRDNLIPAYFIEIESGKNDT